MTNVESLLKEAEALLHKDIEKELEELKKGFDPPVVNPEKYKKAKGMFEEVLVKDSENEIAMKGLEACEDMLEEAIREQVCSKGYGIRPSEAPRFAEEAVNMAGIEDTGRAFPEDSKKAKEEELSPDERFRILKQNYEKLAKKEPNEEAHAQDEMTPIKTLPWEVRRRRLDDVDAVNMAGREETQRLFGEDSKKAKMEVLEIIERARRLVQDEGRNSEEIYQETTKELTAFQECLHKGWKGNGPEILEEALERLRKSLRIK